MASESKDARPEPGYDLTHKMTPFLDPHFVFSMVGTFLPALGIYKEEDILRSQLAVARTTNYYSYTQELWRKLEGDKPLPADMKTAEQVQEKMWELTDACGPLLELIAPGELVHRNLTDPREEPEPSEVCLDTIDKGNFNAEYLEEHHGVTSTVVDALYTLAKFVYDVGEYSAAATYLYYYKQLVPADSDSHLKASWGKFAAEILCNQWDEADRDRESLRLAIEKTSFSSPLLHLQQYSWLLHWSLYTMFHHSKGPDALLDFFFSDQSIRTIGANCPWMLRYIAAVVVTSPRRWSVLKQLQTLIKSEKHQYSDPITEFVEALTVDYDFDGAQGKLKECECVVATDMFLQMAMQPADFGREAGVFVFEMYCRIHRKIDIATMASKIGMDSEEAEEWVVQLVRNAQLKARIDTKEQQVVMGTSQLSVYQRVLERTRDLEYRTTLLADRVLSSRSGRGSGRGGRGGGRGGRGRSGGRSWQKGDRR